MKESKNPLCHFFWRERGYELWGAEQPQPTPQLSRVHWRCPTGCQGQAPGRGTASRGNSGPRWDTPCTPLHGCCGAQGLFFSCPCHIPFHRTYPSDGALPGVCDSRLTSAGQEGCVPTALGKRRNSSHGHLKSCLSSSNTTHGI